jgi:hypothetical protein
VATRDFVDLAAIVGFGDRMKFADTGWMVMEDLPELPEMLGAMFNIAHNKSEPPDHGTNWCALSCSYN